LTSLDVATKGIDLGLPLRKWQLYSGIPKHRVCYAFIAVMVAFELSATEITHTAPEMVISEISACGGGRNGSGVVFEALATIFWYPEADSAMPSSPSWCLCAVGN